MRQPGEKPAIADTARARIQKFHEELLKLQRMWDVEVAPFNDGERLVYVDTAREDDWDGKGEFDAWPDENGKLVFETFDWWGK